MGNSFEKKPIRKGQYTICFLKSDKYHIKQFPKCLPLEVYIK